MIKYGDIKVTNHAIDRFDKRFPEIAPLCFSKKGVIRKLIMCSEIRKEKIARKGNQYIFTNGCFEAIALKRMGKYIIKTIVRNFNG